MGPLEVILIGIERVGYCLVHQPYPIIITTTHPTQLNFGIVYLGYLEIKKLSAVLIVL